MPKYPKSVPQDQSILEMGEDLAELDCGCLVREMSDGAGSIKFWPCTLHGTAQRMLDALDRVAHAAYVDKAADAIMCVFCEASNGEHEDECPMPLVHDIIRQARGGG